MRIGYLVRSAGPVRTCRTGTSSSSHSAPSDIVTVLRHAAVDRRPSLSSRRSSRCCRPRSRRRCHNRCCRPGRRGRRHPDRRACPAPPLSSGRPRPDRSCCPGSRSCRARRTVVARRMRVVTRRRRRCSACRRRSCRCPRSSRSPWLLRCLLIRPRSCRSCDELPRASLPEPRPAPRREDGSRSEPRTFRSHFTNSFPSLSDAAVQVPLEVR